MAALLIKDILGHEGERLHYIFDELDGTFPNHEANPLIPENIVALQTLVVEKGCDVGIIFDGDGDRVIFIDENGRFISPDLMIAVLGHYFLKRGEKGESLAGHTKF
jgi:phosphomannomutase